MTFPIMFSDWRSDSETNMSRILNALCRNAVAVGNGATPPGRQGSWKGVSNANRRVRHFQSCGASLPN